MPAPRVLVLSGSAGNGHVMAGRAVASALQQHERRVEVAHLDAVQRMSAPYARIYRWSYERVVDKHPLLWRYVYDSTDRQSTRVGHALTVLAGKRLIEAVRDWHPRVTVCTHFLAPELLARAIRRRQIQTEMHVVITDQDVHRIWHYPEVARYYVGSELVAARLRNTYRVPAEKIVVTGIPVRPEFATLPSTAAARARLGLDPARPIVVFLSGGFASGPMAESILGVWLERRDAQVVAICGRNERLRRRIDRLPRPTGATLHALGFQREVAPLLALGDVVVSKSGGISTAECMALGRPMVISHAIAGQEERNMHMVISAGAGFWAPTPAEIRYQVGRLLRDPALRHQVASAAEGLGRPEAAARIADEVLQAATPQEMRRGPIFHGA